MHLRIVRPEVVGFDGEIHALVFSGPQRDPLETFELADRARRQPDTIMDVKLNDLSGLTLTRIFDLRADFEASVWGDLRCLYREATVAEVGIGESEAKREKGGGGLVEIPGLDRKSVV